MFSFQIPLANQVVIMFNRTATMTMSLLVNEYIPKVLQPYAAQFASPVALFWDNHSSHMHPETLKALYDANIQPTQLPANTTSILQPLDVVLKKPIKDGIRALYDFHFVVSRFILYILTIAFSHTVSFV